ncbi:MAG: signal peptidase I [Candidatus Aminicenantes bacterium]|nr:signal peptidase I [Candidatus Aminicenantes bacterium]
MTDKKRKKEKKSGSMRENVEMILEVLIIVFFINTFLVQTMGVPTPSMEDHMLIGDHLFVDKMVYSQSVGPLEKLIFPKREIKRGNIVVFKAPPEVKTRNWARLMYVKRVIGLPGDLLQLIDNRIYINEVPLDEPYRNLSSDQRVPINFPPERPSDWWSEFPPAFRQDLVKTSLGTAFRVPEGHYFCMGDNRNLSADSRIWGPVPRDHILGKPWRIYWSFESTTDLYLNRGLPARLKDTVLNFFKKTRWNRMLKRY